MSDVFFYNPAEVVWNFQIIDCQVTSPHLLRLGAVEIPRTEFLARLERALTHGGKPGSWKDIVVEGKWGNV